MKTLMRTIALVMAAVFLVTSATSAFAGDLPGSIKESGVCARETNVSCEKKKDTEDCTVSEGKIDCAEEDNIGIEEIDSAEESDVSVEDTEDREETIVPDGDTDDAEEDKVPEEAGYVDDQTEDISGDDVDITDEESSDEESSDEDTDYGDSYYEESEREDSDEIPAEDLLGDSVIVMPWTALQNRINHATDGDTIVLDMDYNAVNGDTMLIVEGKSITLDLNGHTLDRNLTAPDADGHAILVRKGASLDLINSSGQEAVITGGFANNGGAVNNKGNLWVKNVTFRNNHASYTNGEAIGRGGAVYNEGTLTMRDCVIGGDSSEDSCSASDGGAIFNNKTGEASLRGVVIRNNVSVNHSGGGIVNYGWIYLDECRLGQNRSNSSNGGAIWNSEDGQMIIYGSAIEGNTAVKGCGGGICNKGDMILRGVSAYTCIIAENSAGDAGGIYNDSKAALHIEGISVTNNTSVNHGGGGMVNYGAVYIDDITVTDNTAKSAGGGIWNNGTIEVEGKIEIRDNHSSTEYHNLYLKSGKVLTVAGRISGDSEIRLWGEDMPRPVTSGWKENSGITSREKINDIIFFDTGLNPYLYDDGEVNVCVSYIDRTWDGDKLTEEEKMIPESPKRIPAGGGSLADKCWYAVCDNETVSQILIVPEGKEANIILMNGRKLTTTRGFYVPAANYFKPKGTVNIYGGDITARGGLNAAGIGGGNEDYAGKIFIYGGKIYAQGGIGGAGIGGGDDCEYNDITIYGGTITAQGGKYSAGIGEGNGADTTGHHTITIKGGTVNADGGFYGAGIGGGMSNNSSCKVVIDDGKVRANCGCEASGIGSGAYSFGGGDFSGSVTINGGDVEALALEGSYPIGSFGPGFCGGAGIGAGNNGDVLSEAKITINGGNVTAEAAFGGAAIGAGVEKVLAADGDCNGTITINGGYVSLCLLNLELEDPEDENVAIIGHGLGGEKDGDLNLDSSLKVWFEGDDPVPQDKRAATCHSFSNQWLHIGAR